MDLSPHLTSILDTLPHKPGCYLMKDAAAKVVYVGKAVNLRSRVRSYFHAAAEATPKTTQLVRAIADIEWIVVASELEALILEMNLIKRYRPKYNVRLKDDKRYPYIKVHWADPFPKVSVTRQMVQDGSRYFGPYTSVWAVHQTLDVLRKIFPHLTCDRVITGQDRRACLWNDLHLCSAPCIGAIAQAEYRATIDDLCRFLQGETEVVVTRLKQEMASASAEERYEKAGALRDQLQAIDRVVEKQKIISNERMDSDVIALARANGDACVQVFLIRNGRLIGREYFVLEGTQHTDEAEVMRQFLTQFYDESAHIPPQVLLPTEVEEARIIEEWLRSRRGGEKTELVVPHSGVGRELLDMAAENASETLTALRAQWAADRSRQVEALAELQRALGLAAPPARIECYDISNLQGTAITASMVVFEQGAPRKAHYRRFLIRSVEGQDDFASLREVLARRVARWRDMTGEALPVGRKPDASFSMLPDLLLVDGGKGQLAQAAAVLEEHGLSQRVALAALAKQHEEIFRPGQAESLLLPRNSQALYLVQRIRDEAHRFAISHHREVRTRIGLASQLDAIPGIGPAKRKALLAAFGDLGGIRAASLAELAALPGITEKLAVTIKERL
ncbi:MAG: excinuclease ABC subunit UvrC [Chloroflexi bacterium]|nr:excinuclease ABC subunit UvrC [Chloroflexota bacterium]